MSGSRRGGPSEHAAQVALMQWAELHAWQCPELALLHAVPNGGKRDGWTGKQLKAEGVRAGVPDLQLPVARGGYHALWIEMKVPGGTVRPEQQWWIEQLREQGCRVEVCWGLDHARAVLCEYLGITDEG